MSAVGFAEVFHRRILIVWNDQALADNLVRFILENGGEVASSVDCASEAFAIIEDDPLIDLVFVDPDIENDLALPLVRQLERLQIRTVWVVAHELHGASEMGRKPMPAVYRSLNDPENVIRVKVRVKPLA